MSALDPTTTRHRTTTGSESVHPKDELAYGIAAHDIDPIAEQKLRRKLDMRILPIVTICYLFLFLDVRLSLLFNGITRFVWLISFSI